MKAVAADVLVVLGVALLAYGCSAFSAAGDTRGDDGGWSANYASTDRAMIVAGAIASTVGVLARARRP